MTHIIFYLDVLEWFLRTGQNEQVDWGDFWWTVCDVTPEAWEELKESLRQATCTLKK